MYEFVKLPEYPILIVNLKEQIDSDGVRQIFLESTTQLQKINGAVGLIYDFQGLKELDVEKFSQSLQVFYRISHTVKPDGSIFYAFVGNGASQEKVSALLSAAGVSIPVFEALDAAQTYLRLKVESNYAKQGLKRANTDDLHATLGIAKAMQAATPLLLNGRVSNFPSSGVLKIKDLESQKSLLIIPNHTLIVGRRSRDYDKPDVDLTFWGAYHKGVSRNHAKLTREGTQLTLIDLKSSNGTFVNGDQLTPHEPVVVCDNDEVTFGRLATKLLFQDTLTITDIGE